MIGQSIAHYTITDKIGQGGMGEVYRATDTKLDRDVALKVLPEAFASDEQRMARFSREAKVLASLNHPNIASIYGLEESEGKQALVLELVEGEDLAERIKRGAIPLEESLKIALQIAEALEAAHGKGIIHRDLKPANVKITPEGVVKVLDFGLAKAMEEEVVPEDISHSPTISQLATKAGIILGTAAYMSPEQAKGKTVDKRTDIWAFGAVLFEMLTGRQAFSGEDASEILAVVIAKEPDLGQLSSKLPVRMRELIERCLRKDRKMRLADIADVRIPIQEYLTDPSAFELDATVTTQPPDSRKMIPWLLAGLVVTAVIAGFLGWNLKPLPSLTPDPLTRMALALPSDQRLIRPARHLVIFSPDGTHLVYVANNQLYLRAIDQLEATPIRGTEGAREPFFSPEGEWVGFWAAGELQKVAIAGGAPVTLCEAGNLFGASWGADDRIVFGQGSEGIFQVSANGGTPELLISVDREEQGELAHGPEILPGGDAVLFTLFTGSGIWDDAQIVVQSLVTGERKVLINGGRDARYVPTGHLVYGQEGTLLATPFDVVRLEVTGDRVPIAEGLSSSTITGTVQFAFSDQGSLIYVPGSVIGTNASALSTLLWVDRQGESQRAMEAEGDYEHVRLSPDGKRLAIHANDGRPDVWIYEIDRGILTPLTFGDEYSNSRPIWTPDGNRITFSSTRNGPYDIFWISADGSDEAEPLLTGPDSTLATSWSPDGKVLVFQKNTGVDLPWDIFVLPLESEGKPEPFIATQFNELHPMFSPDGRWIAFTSNRSGQEEVYIKGYPAEGGIIPISTDGGAQPAWSRSGKELSYRNGDKMMVVSIQNEPTFKIGVPELLFEGEYRVSTPGQTSNYDISPDGQLFLMIKEDEQTGETSTRQEIIIVFNWFDELKRLVPTE